VLDSLTSNEIYLNPKEYEQTLSLVRKAVLAPSSHNTQPWFFRTGKAEIDLFADRSRSLPVNDPEDRELMISCGAALMSLRVAAADQGFCVHVRRLPDAGEPDSIARANMSRQSGEPGQEGALADFLETRRTCRKRFARRGMDSNTADQLVDAAAGEGAWLRPLATDETRRQAAILVAKGDAAQWSDPGWRRELSAWMHPRRRGDGLTVPALAAPAARLLIRHFDMGGRVGAGNRALAEAAPLLAVLGTEHDGPHDRILAGEALQRVLLTACRHNLQASYLNQPIQVASLRPRLRKLTGGGFPQLLLRFGYPVKKVPAAPRRPPEDVIRIRDQ